MPRVSSLLSPRSRLGTLRRSGLALLAVAALLAGCAHGEGVGPRTASLEIITTGAPDGTVATITVRDAAGIEHVVTGNGTFEELDPGEYTIEASPIVYDGETYAPTPATMTITIEGSKKPFNVRFDYKVITGALMVSVTGVPTGASATLKVTGPDGNAHTVNANEAVKGLAPGIYSIAAQNVEAGGHTYASIDRAKSVTVVAGHTPAGATISYALATGAIAVDIAGLPSGTPAALTLSGPDGYSRAISGATTITNLFPGTYTLAAAPITIAGSGYAASGSQDITVTPSLTPVQARVSYGLSTGAIAVVVSGLPSGASAAVTISGPGGFSRTLTSTATVTGLAPGDYTLTASKVTNAGSSFTPTQATQTVHVDASAIAAPATVTYTITTGAIAVVVSGLPSGASGSATITGPGGYSKTLTATATVVGLTPGTYTLTAANVNASGTSYTPVLSSQSLDVSASLVATPATVTYNVATGNLTVTITGLPDGTDGAVTITGPLSFRQTIVSSKSFSGIPVGTYTISAASVTAGGGFTPQTGLQNAIVTAGQSVGATVTYVTGGTQPQLNLTIDGMYITQAVQNYAGTVPLVAGRDGYLRVFVKASQPNTVSPTVRVRLYNGATLTSTLTLNGPSSVPTTITEGTLGSSWNVAIPGAQITPTLRLLADVDPDNTVAESNETDNSFPASGSPLALNVQTVPAFNVRLVPVAQTVNGYTGNVNSGNASQFLNMTKKVWPLLDVNVDVRSPYNTSAPVLMSGDDNNAWQQILSELRALQAAEAPDKYYYGVVKVGYNSGVAGLGYVPGHAAMGWDYMPTGDEVAAHELGHNLNRMHAPCGGAASPDPKYPYSGATVGAYGFDVATQTLKATSNYDLMSYCDPAWVSDYNYTAVFNYRMSSGRSLFASTAGFTDASSAAAATQPALLVWGRIRRGQLILEPAFEVVTRPSLPDRPGPYRIEGIGRGGETLFSYSFEGEQPADVDPSDRHFAFAIPLDAAMQGRLASLRLSSATRSVTKRTAVSAGDDATLGRRAEGAAASLTTSGGVHLQWDDNLPMAMVRDAHTGEIIAFARRGDATLRTASRDLDIVFSDGVRSVRRRLAATKR